MTTTGVLVLVGALLLWILLQAVILPRLGVYYDLVCRAKAMTDPLHIMHPDVMPVGDGYRPKAE